MFNLCLIFDCAILNRNCECIWNILFQQHFSGAGFSLRGLVLARPNPPQAEARAT